MACHFRFSGRRSRFQGYAGRAAVPESGTGTAGSPADVRRRSWPTRASTVVLSGVRMPRMNAIMERWVQTCRRELLDRTLIWNQAHLLHALRELQQFYNCHRPH